MRYAAIALLAVVALGVAVQRGHEIALRVYPGAYVPIVNLSIGQPTK